MRHKKEIVIALSSAIAGALLAGNATSVSRICEHRSDLAYEIVRLTSSHYFELTNSLGIPHICYKPTGRPEINIEGNFARAKINPIDAEQKLKNVGAFGLNIADNMNLYASTLRPWDIGASNLSGATILNYMFPYLPSSKKLKVLNGLENYFQTANHFTQKCGDDQEFHDLWDILAERRQTFINALIVLNGQCFNSINFIYLLFPALGGVAGAYLGSFIIKRFSSFYRK